MAELGEIVFGNHLVVGITKSGIPVQYVDLRSNRVFFTSYGASLKQNGSTLISMPEGELNQRLQDIKENSFLVTREELKYFLSTLQKEIKQDLFPDRFFSCTLGENDKVGVIIMHTPSSMLQFLLHKQKRE